MNNISKSPLSNSQIQVILTGRFGDGCLATNSKAAMCPNRSYSYYYMTSSINKEYISFKKDLLGSLCNTPISEVLNCGYKHNTIFKLSTISHPQITEIAKESITKSLSRMDDLGFALWIYDDGSLHKNKNFYNLNTQAFSYDENANLIVPFIKDRFGIIAVPTIERKTDGREFWYLRIKKYEGAFIVSEILDKYYINCFSYKIINKQTRENWDKVRNFLIKENKDYLTLHPRTLSTMLSKAGNL